MRTHIGVGFSETGAAVVWVNHRRVAPDSPHSGAFGERRQFGSWVTRIERPDTRDFGELVERVIGAGTAPDGPLLRIDNYADGAALHDSLIGAKRLQGVRFPYYPRLYRKRAADRQELNALLKTRLHDGTVHFARDLEHRAAMDAAISGRSRIVLVDGVVGSELVVALAMGLFQPRFGGEPEAYGRDGRIYPSVEAARLAGTHVWY